jgi:hypothetical protein
MRSISASPDSTQPFQLIDSAVVGVAESSPIEVISVYVGSNATSVQASFSDGTSDQITVTDGWAVLVDDGSSPLPATVTALDGSGNNVGTATVSSDNAFAEPVACALPFAMSNAGSDTTSPEPTTK